MTQGDVQPALGGVVVHEAEGAGDSLEVCSLTYSYPGHAAIVSEVSISLKPGSRCLLCGANGAGKSTVLQIFGGKVMVDKDMVRVLGQPPFHTTTLTCGGDLSYLGSQWRRNVFAGYDVPVGGDIPAGQMIFGVEGVDPERRERLIRLLDINLEWKMHQVSDGQRRRVQICLGLLKPYRVLLCDEITVDLDVVGRLDLLRFFKQETEERGAVIIYATHIFDGLETWPTHMAYIEQGRMKRGGLVSDIRELHEPDVKLLRIMESWLREEKRLRKAGGPIAGKKLLDASPFASSKHMAYYR